MYSSSTNLDISRKPLHANRPFAHRRKYARKLRDITSGVQSWRTFTIADYGEKPHGSKEERSAAPSSRIICYLTEESKTRINPMLVTL